MGADERAQRVLEASVGALTSEVSGAVDARRSVEAEADARLREGTRLAARLAAVRGLREASSREAAFLRGLLARLSEKVRESVGAGPGCVWGGEGVRLECATCRWCPCQSRLRSARTSTLACGILASFLRCRCAHASAIL